MGQYAKQLHRRLASQSAGVSTGVPERQPGEPLPGGAVDLETLLGQGYDPVHAVYSFVQQISSQFAEGASQLPEMEPWARAVGEAEEEYMPSGPPMSPLTASYFWLWALYDVRIGGSTDTLGSCQIEANDLIGLNEHQLDALKKLNESRMGIYEHAGKSGRLIRLRELITNDEVVCHCPSGYHGTKGELWYARLVPPVDPEAGDYWIVMTTPYILTETDKADWAAYLKRGMAEFDEAEERTRLYRFLKFGPERLFWHEFVFKAYHHSKREAIFLAGIPDVPSSLPHG
jgi:hypothetical protein